MKKRIVFTVILAAVFCAGAVLAGCAKKTASKATESPKKAAEMNSNESFEVEFNFERRSDGELLHALVNNVTSKGASVEIHKRKGRPNYPDTKDVTKTYEISLEQLKQLKDILHRYPLQEVSQGRKSGSYGGNICQTLRVVDGDTHYYINDFVIFPDGLPPMKELVYTDFYNFFNDIASADEAMLAVKTKPLPDPHDNPKYADRVVEQFGKKVHLVPGTGSDNNRSAEIVYGDKKWWIEEGYVGHYVMTDRDKKMTNGPEITEESASFCVNEDGSYELVMNGVAFAGKLSTKRYYKDPPGGVYEPVVPDTGERQGFSFDFNGYLGMFEDDEIDEDREPTQEEELAALRRHIYVQCHGEPHPHVVEPRYMEMTRVSQ